MPSGPSSRSRPGGKLDRPKLGKQMHELLTRGKVAPNTITQLVALRRQCKAAMYDPDAVQMMQQGSNPVWAAHSDRTLMECQVGVPSSRPRTSARRRCSRCGSTCSTHCTTSAPRSSWEARALRRPTLPPHLATRPRLPLRPLTTPRHLAHRMLIKQRRHPHHTRQPRLERTRPLRRAHTLRTAQPHVPQTTKAPRWARWGLEARRRSQCSRRRTHTPRCRRSLPLAQSPRLVRFLT